MDPNDRYFLVCNLYKNYITVQNFTFFYFFSYYFTSVYNARCTCNSVYAVYVYRAAHVYTCVACVNLNNKHNDDDDDDDSLIE